MICFNISLSPPPLIGISAPSWGLSICTHRSLPYLALDMEYHPYLLLEGIKTQYVKFPKVTPLSFPDHLKGLQFSHSKALPLAIK